MSNADNAIHITVDNRERGKIIQKLEAIPGVSLEFTELDCGDYVLGNGVVVERKSSTDFILSIVDRDLVDRVGKLRASYEHPIYIVEGDMYTMRFHQKAFDVHASLAYLSVTQGIPVVASPDPEHSAMLIYLMAVEAERRLGRNNDRRGDKPNVLTEAQQYLIEGLPGVDADRAEALLRHFGSPAGVLAAAPEALAQAGDLPPEKAARIRQVLDSRWRG